MGLRCRRNVGSMEFPFHKEDVAFVYFSLVWGFLSVGCKISWRVEDRDESCVM